MNTYSCPKGHASTESDFCSECGAKIAGAAPAAASAIPSTGAPLCPDCKAERLDADIVFCEVCGYNFSTGAHGEIPLVETVAVLAVPAAVVLPIEWSLSITLDSTAHDAGSPPPPEGIEPIVRTLAKPVNLIGRQSAARAIHPEIPLDFDDAVSHRHAVLTKLDDGSLVLRDIGSSNGTQVNATEVQPMTDIPLHDGDEITLGHWTRIKVTWSV